MVVCFVALEDLVEPLKEKRPETMERPIVPDALCGVRSVMVIWAKNLRAVQLLYQEDGQQ